MKRDKAFYVRHWKDRLDGDPARVALMSEDAWYASLMGLAMRMYDAGLMTIEQVNQELQ